MKKNNNISITSNTIKKLPLGGLGGFFLLLFFWCFSMALHAQVKFTASMQQTAPDEITISFSGTMDKGWHVYAPEEKHGPIAASFNVDKIEGAKLEGALKANKPATKKYDDIWKGEVAFFENNVVFTQKVKLTGKEYKIEGYFEFGACNDETCLPPTSVDFNYSGTVKTAPNQARGKGVDSTTAVKKKKRK